MAADLPPLPQPIPAPTGRRREEAELRELLAHRILVLDGAMGTMIHSLNLEAGDFGGVPYEGCNEALCLTRPNLVRGIHEGYFQAGADIVETNTFGGTPLVLAEFDLRDRAYDINLAAARIAVQAAHRFSTPAKPRFVAGALGPTTKTIAVTGGISFDDLSAHYYEQVRGLVDGGVDILLIETCLDTLNLKTAAVAARRYLDETGIRIPIMLSGTIEAMGTMLAGQPVEALYASVEHFAPLSIGLNCSTGPEFMTHHIRSLSELAGTHVSCYPNAGLPDEEGKFNETPEMIASKLERFVLNGWLNFVGGCCGTTPEHIRLLSDMAAGKTPRQVPAEKRLLISGTEFLTVEQDNRPVIVGERTNSIGSRKFKDLIAKEKFEEAAEIGRKQVKAGAQVVDVCLANPDRDEPSDMERFLPLIVKKVKAPIMIDSTDARVIELSLKHCQGKAIINSVNLEDGEERFEKVCPLARKYGAALVVGCIDENRQQGMALTVARKVEIARRSFDLLTRKHGIPATDIIFDPLVFPCASGDVNYVGTAAQTIEGITAIKDALPEVHTILGISNVSFGLPEASREVLNSVFLYHCTRAGLDFAIVNSEKLARYALIPPREREAAEDLLYNRRADAIDAFAALFREARKKIAATDAGAHLTVEQRIAHRVVEGTKEGLIDNLNLALEKYTPLEVVNGPLMAGMDEVGRLFGANELIVAEVLQSAEVMKAAISHLEQFMDKATSNVKATFLLATVKGDVHDIGKNLVEIIFSNNGYKIINLGIKCPSETLIQAFREHKPDAIGLSGLLVKSAQQMVVTAGDLRHAGISVPLFVGGAALTKKFTTLKIAPEYDGLTIYAKDAMEGLDLANRLTDAARRPELEAHLKAEGERLGAAVARPEPAPAACTPRAPAVSKIARDWELKTPPDLKRHVLRDFPLDEIQEFVNPQMLYSKHLGLRGNFSHLIEAKDEKALKLLDTVTYMQDAAQAHGWIRAAACWRFFPACGDGNDLVLFTPDGKTEIERFTFPRQTRGDGLCLADYCAAAGSGKQDYVALFVVTCGEGLREHVERFKNAGEYVKCHVLQALAIESAEAFAELLHMKLRAMWGFPDPAELTMQQRFTAHYHGLRVSFGYPACPRLEDQEILFRLLQPDDVGVRLTEGFMMDPESSVSALVFQHPEAKYFGVDAEGLKALEVRG